MNLPPQTKISGSGFNGMRFPHSHDLAVIFGSDWERFIPVLQQLSRLPFFGERILRFSDLDDTLVSRQHELYVDEGLRHLRGDAAYPYIDERGGVDWYIKAYHDRAMAKFDNYMEALYGLDGSKNKQSVILTAGKIEQQRRKIQANLLHFLPSIITHDAKNKMQEILNFIIKLGYIPGRIEFIDDRIDNFVGADLALSRILGIPVHFERAIPNGSRVIIENVLFSGVKMDLQ